MNDAIDEWNRTGLTEGRLERGTRCSDFGGALEIRGEAPSLLPPDDGMAEPIRLICRTTRIEAEKGKTEIFRRGGMTVPLPGSSVYVGEWRQLPGMKPPATL